MLQIRSHVVCLQKSYFDFRLRARENFSSQMMSRCIVFVATSLDINFLEATGQIRYFLNV